MSLIAIVLAAGFGLPEVSPPPRSRQAVNNAIAVRALYHPHDECYRGPFPFDLNADGVLSDYEEFGYGRIDTCPRQARAE